LLACGGFLVAVVGLAGFVGDFGLPKTVNAGGEVDGLFALAVNGGLILLFGLQHSLMARPGFKQWLAEFLPPAAERPTFILATALMLGLLFALWQPIPADIWRVDGVAGGLLSAGFWLGWLIVGLAASLTGHLEFTGLGQVWQAFRHRRGRPPKPAPPRPFVTRSLYRFVRHPMYTGLLMTFWLTPRMTVGHLLFAAGMTGYLLIGLRFEERDLLRRYGRRYRAYQRRVPALIPRPAASLSGREAHRPVAQPRF
jgi:protein-S-isoprenylcysteine O-methyltransferase Ste14